MAKFLIIVRHAKSSWADPSDADFDRPLNERGKKDAPEMARRLKNTPYHPELIISSPANRAITTAKVFAETFEIPFKSIIQVPELYHASVEKLLARVKDLPENAETIALFGHNPGLTDFVNFVSLIRLDNLPTCGIVVLETEDWRDFGRRMCTAKWFDYPKNHADE